MSLIIYTTKDDIWIEKVKEYAAFNSWSLSKAIRQILKAFVQVNMLEDRSPDFVPEYKPALDAIKNYEPEKSVKLIKGYQKPNTEIDDKIDLATFEAENMAKLNVNQNMEACIREHTIDGQIFCYMFDNAREYHPFCKSECWTDKTIWKERVRP